MRLVDGNSVESLTEEFDNDAIFIDGAIEFLIDMRWVKYNHIRGSYRMTKIGEMKVTAWKTIFWI
jgi:hypothetical protein